MSDVSPLALQVYSDNGKREVQTLRSAYLDITQKLSQMKQVLSQLWLTLMSHVPARKGPLAPFLVVRLHKSTACRQRVHWPQCICSIGRGRCRATKHVNLPYTNATAGPSGHRFR